MQHGTNFNKFNVKALRKRKIRKILITLIWIMFVKPPTEASPIVQRKQNIKAIELIMES